MYKSSLQHYRSRCARPLVVLACASCLVTAGAAYATEGTIVEKPMNGVALGQVFTFLFLMLGPFKIVGPFFKVTQGADALLTRQIAVWATVFSALALLIAGFLGEFFLGRFGIPLPVLFLSGGIILFLVALKSILEQFEPPEYHHPDGGGLPPTAAMPQAAMKLAMAPLAFPTIVTPYGIASLIVALAFSTGIEGRLEIGAVVVGIMVLNLIVMLTARRLQAVLALALPIFGAVLGVVQVALGLQIVSRALQMLVVL